jgi:hypothetical protein
VAAIVPAETWADFVEKDGKEADGKIPEDVRKLIGQKVKALDELQAGLVNAERKQRKQGRGKGSVNSFRKQAETAEIEVCEMLGRTIPTHGYLTLPDGRMVFTKFLYDETSKKQPRWHLQFLQK